MYFFLPIKNIVFAKFSFCFIDTDISGQDKVVGYFSEETKTTTRYIAVTRGSTIKH